MEPDQILARLLLEQGLVTDSQIDECRRLQGELAQAEVRPLPGLGELLVRKGFLSPRDVPAPAQELPPAVRFAAEDPANRIGGYVRVKRLGVGGMGEVWKSWDTGLHRWVALKLLRPREEEDHERFRREALTSARLNHPHIVQVYEAGDRFIAMQLVDGRSLLSVPREDRRALAEILRQAALALQYAHEQGVVHRDLKPANLMVSSGEKPHVYVMDFGLAKATQVPGSISVSGTIVGTPSYMSPEQVMGSRDLDGRTDVYSLGATLYELLTDRAPFQHENVFEVFKLVTDEEPVPVRRIRPKVEPDLETIVSRCLEKNPSDRYPSALELAQDLERFLRGEPILARPVSWATRVFRRVTRHRAVALLAVAAVAASGIGAWALLRASRVSQEKREVEERLARRLQVSEVLRRWQPVMASLSRAPRGHDPAGRSREARAAVDRFVAETPRDPVSQAAMKSFAGWAYWRMEWDSELGRQWLRESRKMVPDLGYSYLNEALKLFEDFVWKSPTPVLWSSAGGTRLESERSGDPKFSALRIEVLGLLRRGRAATLWGEGANEAAEVMEAIEAFDRGDLESADRGLTRGLTSPDLALCESTLLMARARVRCMRRDHAGALSDLQRASGLHGEGEWVGVFTSDVLLDQALEAARNAEDARARLRRVVAGYESALTSHPEEGEILSRVTFACLRLGEAELEAGGDPHPVLRRAVDTADRWVRVEWEIDLARLTRGCLSSLLWQRGAPEALFEAARADFDEVLRRRSDNVAAYVNRGNLFRERGWRAGWEAERWFEPALADLNRALERDRESTEAYEGRGMIHRGRALRSADPRAGLRGAIEEFGEALRYAPNSLSVQSNLAGTWVDLATAQATMGEDGRPSVREAVRVFSGILARRPTHRVSRINRGVAYSEWGRLSWSDPLRYFESALADLNAALEGDPNHPDARCTRGFTHFLKSRRAEEHGLDPTHSQALAERDLTVALRARPIFAKARANLGLLFEAMGRKSEALREFELALAIDPSIEYARRFVARARTGR